VLHNGCHRAAVQERGQDASFKICVMVGAVDCRSPLFDSDRTCDRVRISVAQDDGTRILIEDDGPGVPRSELTKLDKRGVRHDEQTAGSGLGLAIAMEHYG
jgi:nitrogen-specific signal transduction histidine kinase